MPAFRACTENDAIPQPKNLAFMPVLCKIVVTKQVADSKQIAYANRAAASSDVVVGPDFVLRGSCAGSSTHFEGSSIAVTPKAICVMIAYNNKIAR